MIDEMDQKLHKFCTEISHGLQRATGLTCYFIARIGIALTALNILACTINYFFLFLPEKTSLMYVAIGGLVLCSCIAQSIACQRADDSVGNNTKPVELIRYTNVPFWRILWVALVFIDFCFVHWAHPVGSLVQETFFSVGCAIFYNFVNVTPLPPGTSKLREWLNGFSRTPELARQEN